MTYKRNALNGLKRSMAFILVMAMVLTSMGISGWGMDEAYAGSTVYSAPVENAITTYYGVVQDNEIAHWEDFAAVYSYLEGIPGNTYDGGVDISGYVLPETGTGAGGLFTALMKGDAGKAGELARDLVSGTAIKTTGSLFSYALTVLALEAYNRSDSTRILQVQYSTVDAINYLLENQDLSKGYIEIWDKPSYDSAGYLLAVLSLPTFSGCQGIATTRSALVDWIKTGQSSTTGAILSWGEDSANSTACVLYGLLANGSGTISESWISNAAIGLVNPNIYTAKDGWFTAKSDWAEYGSWNDMATRQATLALVDVEKGNSFFTNIKLNSKHYISTTMQLVKADGSFVEKAVTVVTGTSLGGMAFKVSGSAVAGVKYYENGKNVSPDVVAKDGSTVLAVASNFENITYFSNGESKLGVPRVDIGFGASAVFTVKNLELSTGAITPLASVPVDTNSDPYGDVNSDANGNVTINPIEAVTNLTALHYDSWVPSNAAILTAKINMAPGGTQKKTVSVRIEGLTGQLVYYSSYDVVGDGTRKLTAKNAIDNAMGTVNILPEYSYGGSYLATVGGLGARGSAGWNNLINGDSPNVGVDRQVINDGDEIVLYYGHWGAYVNLESAISGGALTLTVLNGTIPVTGVSISWNGRTLSAVTDDNGKVVIDDVVAGVYPVQISKLDEDFVPLVLRLPVGTTVTVNDAGESFQKDGVGLTDLAKKVFLTVKGLWGKVIYGNTGQTYYVGITARDVLGQTGLSISGSRAYVTAINGLSEFDYGSNSGWLFTVNGEVAGSTPSSSYRLSVGDDVLWYYTTDYKKDSGSSAWKDDETKTTEFVAKEDGKGSATTGVTNAEIAKLVKDGGVLKAKSSIATIELDLDTVKGLSKLMGKDLEITAKKIDISKHEGITQEMKDQIGDRPVLDLTVMSGSKQISNFDGKVTVSIPYTLKAGENPSTVVIYLLKDDGTMEMIKNGTFDSKTGEVRFTTDHFSLYGIGYKAIEFKDIDSHWAKEDIAYLAARDYISGMTKETFDPNGTLTRGQFVQLLAKLAGSDLTKYGKVIPKAISDVKTTDWFAPSVNWALEQGIVTGVSMPDGTTCFYPEQSISRQDIAVMLNRYKDKIDKKAFPENVKEKTFQDKEQIGQYAKDAVAALQKSGIIQGKSETVFAPLDQAKRGEAAKMIHGMLKLN